MSRRKIKPVDKKRQAPSKQTRVSGGSYADKLNAYLHIHAHALFFSLGRLIRSPFTAVMTIAVLAIAISLAGGFYLFVANVQQFTGNLESSNQISLFLKLEISDKKGKELARRIADNQKIQQVNLITKQEALDEFQVYSGFGEALKALDKNPLPTVIQITPKNTLENQLEVETLLKELQRFPEVDFAQLDMQWVKRLQSIMKLARRGTGLLSFLLAIAVLFITGNTIRLELQNRRDEVLIAKLVGATHSFIQRPFLYTGFWYGFLAGVAALFIIVLMELILQQPMERLLYLYNGNFNVLFLSFSDSIALLFVSSFLGITGALIVLVYQLNQLKPE